MRTYSMHFLLLVLGAVLAAPLVGQDPDKGDRIDSLLSAGERLLERSPNAALEAAEEARRMAQAGDDLGRTARAFELLARVNYELLDLETAVSHCGSARRRYAELRDASGAGRIDRIEGEVLGRAGDYLGASELLERSLTNATRAKDTAELAAVHRALARVHYMNRQFDLMWEHLEKAFAYYKGLGDVSGMAAIYGRMAIYSAEDEGRTCQEVSVQYSDSGLQLARSVGDSALMESLHINLALILMQLQELELSKAYTDSALWSARARGDSLHIVHAYENMGQMAERYDEPLKAIEHCTHMLNYGRRHGLVRLERDAWRCIMDGYRESGQWEEAFAALIQYFALRDITYNSASREAILERSLEAAAARREEMLVEAHDLREEQLRERWLATGGGALGLLFVGFLIYKRRQAQFKRDQANRERDNAMLREQVLRARIDQHFLGNAMSSIQLRLRKGRAEEAAGLLMRYDRFLRSTLEQTAATTVSVADEVETLQRYLSLEQGLRDGSFDFVVEVDDRLDAEGTTIEPMLVQPFVENAVKHGVGKKEGKGTIAVHFRLEDACLVVTVSDDGPGVKSQPQAPDHLSWGTRITGERLAILRKLGGQAGTYEYLPVPAGTTVEVRIPLRERS